MVLTGEYFSVSGDFSAEIDVHDNGALQHFGLEWVGRQMTFGEAVAMWKWNAVFTQFCGALIRNSGLKGFVWECPPVTKATLERPFEFVLIDTGTPYHARPDADVFSDHFKSANNGPEMAVFPNLGGDALLIAPAPKDDASDYRDLNHFLSNASDEERAAFWKAVSDAMDATISDNPVWLSVAGAGEAWLHVRLDSRPKYYQHTPYRGPR
ncbi:MAG: hypothetical protein CMK07_02495 [Ponticaulis sp.]|nr:hypothetical protein [Ponticaulis sp.]